MLGEHLVGNGASKYAEAIVIDKPDSRIGQGPQKYLALGVARENGADYLCSGGKFVEQRIGRGKILRMHFNHMTPADID